MAKQRYSVEYASTTGYGWEQEANSLGQFSAIIELARKGDYYMHLVIWDEKKKDFVFWKKALERKPEIDKLLY